SSRSRHTRSDRDCSSDVCSSDLGQYTTPVIYAEVTAVFTNTAPVDAYRGAGRPEATYVVERLVETAAREMKMSPAEIRRRNFIKIGRASCRERVENGLVAQ